MKDGRMYLLRKYKLWITFMALLYGYFSNCFNLQVTKTQTEQKHGCVFYAIILLRYYKNVSLPRVLTFLFLDPFSYVFGN